MRRANSILLLVTFLLVQYARHVNYLQCKAVNYFATSSSTCDCMNVFAAEKQPAENKESLPEHSHIHLDENFCPSITDYFVNQASCANIIRSTDQSFHLCPGYADEAGRPPALR